MPAGSVTVQLGRRFATVSGCPKYSDGYNIFAVKDRIILEIIESVIEKGSRICINLSSVGSKRDAYKPFAIPLGVSDQRV